MRRMRRRLASMANSVAAGAAAAVTTVSAFVGFVGGAPPAQAAPVVRTVGAVLAQVEVIPTSEDFPGGQMMQKMINWAGQFGLWGSVASLLVGAGIWGISQHFGNGYQAGKGKILVAAGAIGAVFTGLAPIIVNTLYDAAQA